MIRIFLADDHAILRDGLEKLIDGQPDMKVVGQAGDGQVVLKQVRDSQPDVVLMDISIPKLNGIKITEQLKELCPKVKVLALTRHRELAYFLRIKEAGASGYVLKQSAAQVLIGAIRDIAAGRTWYDPEITGRIVDTYVGRQTSKPRQHELSEREQEVLSLIAWGCANKEIADQLNISVKTVEYHKANAMGKLDLHTRTDIVRYALLQGWLQDKEL